MQTPTLMLKRVENMSNTIIGVDHQCPFCGLWKRLEDPNTRSQCWVHKCAGRMGEMVWFLNGYALAGAGNYNAAVAAEVAGRPKL